VLWRVSVWGVGLAVRRLLCAGKYIASLIKYEWGGPQHPAHGGRYVSGDPVHDLASARGHEWLATCVRVQDVLSQGILAQQYDLWHFRVFGESPARYRHLVVIFDPA